MNFNTAEFYRSFGEYSQLPPSDRMEIAFSGRSNVGKSSLINKVLGRRNIARVSSMPGKQRRSTFLLLKISILQIFRDTAMQRLQNLRNSAGRGLLTVILKAAEI